MLDTTRLVRHLIITVAMAALALPAVAQQAAAPQKPAAQGEKGPAAVRGKRGEGQPLMMGRQQRDPEAIVAAAWWNDDEKVGALGLKAEQRSTMDARLKAFIEERDERIEAGKAALKPFLSALEKGDLEAAKKAIPALEAAEASQARDIAELRIDVLSALTAAQRATLGAEHAELLRQDWTSPRRSRMRMRGPRRGPDGGEAKTKPGGGR